LLFASIFFVFLNKEFLFAVIFFLSAIRTALSPSIEKIPEMKEFYYQGIVIGEDHKERGMKLSIEVEKVITKSDTIYLNLPVEHYTYKKGVYLGKKVLIKGHLLPSDKPYRKNILSGTIVQQNLKPNFTHQTFYTIASYIDNFLKENLSPEHYSIASGLLLGGSGRTGKELQEVFTRAGVLHILSVSGLHVGFVISFLGFIFIFLPIPRPLKFALTMLFLFVYAGVTGFRPSVIRASLMAFLFGGAFVLQRNIEPIHILNITALILLILQPLMLFDASTQLSFASVYGILYLFPKIDRLLLKKVSIKTIKPILVAMAISFSAQIFVSPVIIYYFNRLQTLSIFSNILIVPLSSVIIYLLFSVLLMSLLFLQFAKIVIPVISVTLEGLISVSKFFAQVSFASIHISVSPVFLFLFYLLFVKSLRRFAVYLIIVFSLIFSLSSLTFCATIKMTDEWICITLPDKNKILITSEEKPSPILLNEIEEVDYLIAPKKFLPCKREFIEYPDFPKYKKIGLGELKIEIGEEINIEYGRQRIGTADYQLKEGKILAIITDGRGMTSFMEDVRGSFFDRLIDDFKFTFAKFMIKMNREERK